MLHHQSKLPFENPTAIVIDDERTSALILSSLLHNLGLNVETVNDGKTAIQKISAKHYDIAFIDYRLGDTNGLELLREIQAVCPQTRTVMITAHGSIELALNAMRTGAQGFISKPFTEKNVGDEVQRAFKALTNHAVRLPSPYAVPSQLSSQSQGLPPSGIIGSSEAVLRIHDQINRMKDVQSTVLICGESGTGKELIAQALHHLSDRKVAEFAAINCAAIPETLLEAELFGYRKGAFTDAKADRKGLFESCSDGTLFLDEIGEIPLNLQAKLLRVLQEKVVTPLGSSKSIRINTRIVAATNRNLRYLVSTGAFRKDLFYRLSVLQIESPPLRDRPEDIPELVSYFVSSLSQKLNKPMKFPSDQIMARLKSYSWPGNVRELQNACERAIVLSADGEFCSVDMCSTFEPTYDGDGFDGTDLEPETLSHSPALSTKAAINLPLSEARDRFEKNYLEHLLRSTKGNVAQASRIAGRMRTDMYRLFAKHDLNPHDFK